MPLAVASRGCSTAIKQAELGLSTHTMSSEHRIRVEYFDTTTKMGWRAGVPRPMVNYTGDGNSDRTSDVLGVENARRPELRLAAPRWFIDDRLTSVVEAIDKAAVCSFQNKRTSFVRRATRRSIEKAENFPTEADGLVQVREPSMKRQTGGSCRLDSGTARTRDCCKLNGLAQLGQCAMVVRWKADAVAQWSTTGVGVKQMRDAGRLDRLDGSSICSAPSRCNGTGCSCRSCDRLSFDQLEYRLVVRWWW